jgi:signal transduction histidine kinase
VDGVLTQEALAHSGRWTRATIAGVIAVALVTWLILILTVSQMRFIIVAPEAKAGFEIFLALLRLFAALVLFLFPAAAARPRLRWVALGFLILALGGIGFGYLYPAVVESVDLNTTMYGSLIARGLAMLVIMVGLALPRPPTFSPRLVLLPLVAFAVLSAVAVVDSDRLPTLVAVDDLEAIAVSSMQTLTGLTPWHWSLSLLPLLFATIAAIGAVRHYPGRALGGWVAAAVVLAAGSQLHTLFWPSAYSPVLTTSSLLRLAFTAVVTVGGFLELRRVATERATALAAQREYAARLQELAALRADFTAIVAHELGNPLAAIRQAAELLAMDPLNAVQSRALAAITNEAQALTALVADVRAVADADREDFAVQPRPVPMAQLLAAAATYAAALPGDHPVDVDDAVDASVRADPERIGQVLRNLLRNAATYSPPGTPITLRTARHGDHVRVAVTDCGYGIHPDDLNRIFEKFGRGRELTGQNFPGAGLGLYLSRRIVQAHSSDLVVASTPGVGTDIAFDLEVVP